MLQALNTCRCPGDLLSAAHADSTTSHFLDLPQTEEMFGWSWHTCSDGIASLLLTFKPAALSHNEAHGDLQFVV